MEQGRVVFEAAVTEPHMNPMGVTRGGFAATLMDSVDGSTIHTMLEPGMSYGTLDITVKLMHPVAGNVRQNVPGNIENISLTLRSSDGTLKGESGKLFAHAISSCMIDRED